MELRDRSQVVEVTHQGKRYVLAGGGWRRKRDAERRTIPKELNELLEKPGVIKLFATVPDWPL